MQDILYIPEIDHDIPLPKSATEAMPELTPFDELEMRARTIKLLSDLTTAPLEPKQTDKNAAHELAKKMIQDPNFRPDFAKYSDPTMAYLAGMIQRSNVQLVDELSELKNYVINKLLLEVENATSAKDRISALSKLGEVDGIDAFKRRSEMTVKIKPIEEVERELITVIQGLEYKVLEDKSHEQIPEISPVSAESQEREESGRQGVPDILPQVNEGP